MDRNWPRWIFASASKHFDDRKGVVPLHIEGQNREQDPRQERAEFRMNGPFVNNPCLGLWILDVNLDIFLNIALDDQDAHKVQRLIGQWTKAFEPCIPVYKYGDGAEDSGALLGALQIREDKGDTIIVTNFGQVSASIPMFQVGINAMYKIVLL